MIISVINNTDIGKDEVQRVLRGVNRQLQEDFAKYWHKDVQLRLEGWTGEAIDPDYPIEMRGDAVIYLWGTEPEDALGFHDLNNSGVPYGFVFTELSKELNEPWSVTLSHEALELAVDPEANLFVSGPDPEDPSRSVLHWYEICDAVQAQTYEIDDVAVSNFLLPLYFTQPEEHQNHNDFLGASVPSFGVAAGGYIGYLDPETNETGYYDAPDELAQKRRAIKSGYAGSKRVDRHDKTHESDSLATREDIFCEAITFELVGSDADEQMQSAVHVSSRVLGDQWNLEQNEIDPSEFDAIYTGKNRLAFGDAWDLVHQLEVGEEVLWAEPSLVAPVPGEYESPAQSVLRSPGRASGKSGDHLEASAKKEWSLKLCNVPDAWKLIRDNGGQPGAGIRVGHPDSGYIKHNQLDPIRLLTDIDRDFLGNDEETSADNGNHGLATGSVIMSSDDQKEDRVTGTAPNAELLPLRVTSPGWIRPAPVLLLGGMATVEEGHRLGGQGELQGDLNESRRSTQHLRSEGS